MSTHRTRGRGSITDAVAGRLTKFLVVGLWLVLATAAAPLALQLTEVQDNETLGGLPRGAESTEAYELAKSEFAGGNQPVAVTLYAREDGLTGADRAKVEADRAAFTRYAFGGQVPPAFPSEDGKALLVSFPLAGGETEQGEAITAIRDRLADAPDGLTTALGGDAGAMDDVLDAFEGLDLTLVLVTAGVVTLILLITYRSPILWVIPLLSVGVASQVASGAVYLLAKHAGMTVDLQGQNILTVLVFGVGTDYALLLIARYREELRRHQDRHAAMAVALRRSFPAILASATTVAVGLLCLLAALLPSTRSLGPVGAIGVVAALVTMTTLLPAALVVFGRWLFWPFVPRYETTAVDTDVAADHGRWAKVADLVGRRPRLTWIGTAVALGALALGAGNLSIGMTTEDTFTTEVGSVTAQRLIERHYPGGASSPTDVIAAAPAADQVAAAVSGVDGVAEVRPPEPSTDGEWVRIAAVLDSAPDSEEAERTVERLRDAVHGVPGADAQVGGATAIQLDTERAAARDNWLLMPLILAVVLVVLIVLLRALVAPLVLLASVVLSFAAAVGAAGLILTAIGHPKLFYGLPLQAFLFLVALGVDYTIFLMTRAREEALHLGARAAESGKDSHARGIRHALTVTGGVITSAGLVLAATFAALGVLPLVPSVQIGITVAVGVLLDTLVVRSLLVPAVALDVGPRIWWPSAMGRSAMGRALPVITSPAVPPADHAARSGTPAAPRSS